MMTSARSKRWTAALAASSLGLTLLAGSPAGATSVSKRRQPPAARLIRIGPQALVSQDEHGRVTMVDEPASDASGGSGRATLGMVVGALEAVGVVGVFLWQDKDQIAPVIGRQFPSIAP